MKREISTKPTDADQKSDSSDQRREFETSSYSSITETGDGHIEGFTTGSGSFALASEKYEAFILGSPIPDPKTLDDEEFKAQIIKWFYQVIRLHTEHIYSERSNEIIGKILVNNVKQLEPEEGQFLTEWFLDDRFISLFSLFQDRIYNPFEIQKLVAHVAKKYGSSQKDSHEVVTIPHAQIWGTFINDADSSSLLNILINLAEEAIQSSDENKEDIQKIKASLEKAFSELGSDFESRVEEEKNHQLSDSIIEELFDRIINDIELRVIDLCFSLIRGEIAKRVANCIENHPELLSYLKEQEEISDLIKRGIIQAEIYLPQNQRVQEITNHSLLNVARGTQDQSNIVPKGAVDEERTDRAFSKWDALHIITGLLLIGAGATAAVFLALGTFGLALIPTAIVAVAAGAISGIGVLEGLRGIWKKISGWFSRFRKKNKAEPATPSQESDKSCHLEEREEQISNAEPFVSEGKEEEGVDNDAEENQALLHAIVSHLKENPSLALPVIKKIRQESPSDLPELDFLRHFFDMLLTHRFKGLRDLKVTNLEQWMTHFFETFLTTLNELCRDSSRNSDEVMKTLDSSFEDEDLVQALGKISQNELNILKRVHERLLELTKEEDEEDIDISEQAKKLTSLFMPVYANIIIHDSSGEISNEQFQLFFKSLSETSKQLSPARSVSKTVLAQALDAAGGTRQDAKEKEEEAVPKNDQEGQERDCESIDAVIRHGNGVFAALDSKSQTPAPNEVASGGGNKILWNH